MASSRVLAEPGARSLDFRNELPNSFGEGHSKGKSMEHLPKLAAAMLTAGVLALPASASAKDVTPCFFVSQWTSSHALDDNTILLRVNHKDIYKVTVSGGASELNLPGTYLLSESHGNSVCSHMDLQLSAAETSSRMRRPMIASALVKLTPQEIALIPKKDLPAR
jgi:hypothetical protein